jgi:two-component system, OmpR family, sensor histidine kinase MprB
MKLRTRFLIATSVIVFLTVGILSVAIFATVSKHLLSEVDNTLDARVIAIAESIRPRYDVASGNRRQRNPLEEALLPIRFDTVTQVIDPRGNVVIALGQVDLPISNDVLEMVANPLAQRMRITTKIDGVPYRILSVPILRGGALQLGRDISDIESAKDGILLWLFVLGLLAIAASGSGGWFIARRTARPIQKLAAAAEHIAATRELTTTLDISGDAEIEQLATSFNTMLVALRLSREQQQQLVQDASHELRTPLTSLRANSELLERENLDADTRISILRDIRAEVDELAALTSELSSLASDQRLVEQLQIVNLGEAVEEVADRARRRSGRIIDLHLNAPANINLRPSQLDRAISNLIDNALKFCPTSESVDIFVNNKRIDVCDYGPGISDADKPHIFDRFYRAVATRALPGSGLGLAIVKQFADDHDAIVGVNDTPGGGATISIQFSE